MQGVLTGSRDVSDGVLRAPLGLLGWVPTLPDPYVANLRAALRGADVVRSLLTATVTWSQPPDVSVTFDGDLGSIFGASPHEPSPPGTRPAPGRDDPPAGPTQVDQHALAVGGEDARRWKAARGDAASVLEQAAERAAGQNAESLAAVEGAMRKVVGPAPSVVLLDVSTNQDLFGVGLAGGGARPTTNVPAAPFSVAGVTVQAPVEHLRVVALPQVQWEPVRTLDSDQDILTMGWFPTPLASAHDGGATVIGVRSARLSPVVPAPVIDETIEAFRSGTPVGVRTTFPFGLVAAVEVQPQETATRKADVVELTRPDFTTEGARGGLQITARAEAGRPDDGGVSPGFGGVTRQLLNGVDLETGTPLGISVLGSTGDPSGSVETVFNLDMSANPKVPVGRFDISGYGGSGFSDWSNPFAAFAEAAMVQLRYTVGRTSLEVIKVNSVLHPWGVRVTRSVTVERRPGGGVVRRDSGWQAFTPGMFDYRYLDEATRTVVVPDYVFDAGVFRGLFDARSIRPAPGPVFSAGGATLVPYYFDADVALEGVPGRTPAREVLGYLQTTPNGDPAPRAALQALLEQQGPVGGTIDTWTTVGASGVPFRAQRIEVGLADDAGTPLFVATVRGAPQLPTTGAWSVVRRPVTAVAGDGEAVPVGADRGVPLVRRYPVAYAAGDTTVYPEPPLAGASGDHRLADAADLLELTNPAHEYALLQSTPTHALLFPRPVAPVGTPSRLESGDQVAVADIIARSTSKGAFPAPGSTLELAPGARHLDVGAGGTLALSAPVDIVSHPTPLRVSGSAGHGSELRYDTASLHVELQHHRWAADFSGLRLWSDIAGLREVTGNELRIVGSTEQRPQIAQMTSLLQPDIEKILQYIPLFGARGSEGPVDLGATNAKHEVKFEAGTIIKFPKKKVTVSAADPEITLTLSTKAKSGIDATTGGVKASAGLGAELEGRIPVATVGVASVFVIVALEVKFSLTSVTGTVTAEQLDLMAFAGIGVKGQIGPFEAYAFLGVGFVLEYDAITDQTKYGGLVALEAGVDLKVVDVKIRAELKGLVYDDAGTTKCDYSGSVEINVDIFFVISISASYQVTETATL